jgi:hypothetical protein
MFEELSGQAGSEKRCRLFVENGKGHNGISETASICVDLTLLLICLLISEGKRNNVFFNFAVHPCDSHSTEEERHVRATLAR